MRFDDFFCHIKIDIYSFGIVMRNGKNKERGPIWSVVKVLRAGKIFM